MRKILKGGVLIMSHMEEVITAKWKEKMEFLSGKKKKKRTVEKLSKDVRTEIM